jgi:hypothetical protein
MKKRWLALLLAHAMRLVPGGLGTGYLAIPQARGSAFRVVPYRPQPGDVLLYDMPQYTKLFHLCGSGAPMHAAIVFAKPDGTPAILDITGPQLWLSKVQLLEPGPRLHNYPDRIMVRQPRRPLTPEQSAALTRFALQQDGKSFALGRLLLQGTPFRCRYGLRRLVFGQTYADRSRWICSEMVVAAAASAGLFDLDDYPANAMYPRDLAYDEAYDLSAVFEAPVLWLPQAERAVQAAAVR